MFASPLVAEATLIQGQLGIAEAVPSRTVTLARSARQRSGSKNGGSPQHSEEPADGSRLGRRQGGDYGVGELFGGGGAAYVASDVLALFVDFD